MSTRASLRDRRRQQPSNSLLDQSKLRQPALQVRKLNSTPTISPKSSPLRPTRSSASSGTFLVVYFCIVYFVVVFGSKTLHTPGRRKIIVQLQSKLVLKSKIISHRHDLLHFGFLYLLIFPHF